MCDLKYRDALSVQLPRVLTNLVLNALLLKTPCCGVLTPDTTLSPCEICDTLLCDDCVWRYYRGTEDLCHYCIHTHYL